MIIHRYMHDGSTINALELMVMRAEFCNQSIKLQSSGLCGSLEPEEKCCSLPVSDGSFHTDKANEYTCPDSCSGEVKTIAEDSETGRASHPRCAVANNSANSPYLASPDSPEGSVASMGILPAEPSQDFVIEYAVCSHPDCIPVLTPLHDLDDYICFATGEHLCASCIDVHRPTCGPCTWHMEQQREQILKGTPVLDLEAWGKDQQ